jgi:hypothetical protein
MLAGGYICALFIAENHFGIEMEPIIVATCKDEEG